MSKYIKPEFDKERLGINPFLSSLIVTVNKVPSADRYTQDGNDWYKGGFDYDASDYTKVFNGSKNRLATNKLSARGKDLYLWLIYEADKGKDYLWLNKERYMEECGINAPNTYRAALNNLIKHSLIVKSIVTDVVWLNPQFFFNGNRIKSFPDNVKIK